MSALTFIADNWGWLLLAWLFVAFSLGPLIGAAMRAHDHPGRDGDQGRGFENNHIGGVNP